jgi:hypothetical protein
MQLLNNAAMELRANPRLRYGLLAIVMVFLVEGGLRWSDAITLQQQKLTTLQSDLAALKSGMRNEAALRDSVIQAQRMGETMDARLWSVTSEAVGQARLKDWLTDVVKSSIADQYAITLGNSRELEKLTSDQTLREFRANASFRLTPRALEGVLLAIEGGEPFAAVETLTVKGQERRVELTVRVLMRIKGAPHD